MLDGPRGRRDLPELAVIALVAWSVAAFAQDYAFPSATDAALFYPTAYYDQGGVTDWNCGGITYAGHRGSDFGVGGFAGMDAGRTVTAAAPGVVVAVNDGEFDRCTTADCPGGGGFGNYVQIEHPDGKTTYYAHLKQWSVAVSVGDAVACGTPLGEVGSSGYSTGPHLHFEVRTSSNVSVDPFDGPCAGPPSYWVDQGAHGGLPLETCGPPPVCEPQAALGCGSVVSARNDGPGSVNATSFYGCDDQRWVGPEQVFSLEVPVDLDVTVTVSGMSADLDLMVLDAPACDGTGCVIASTEADTADEAATFPAAAGVSYVVVVDGWEGAVSDFRLDVSCPDLPAHTGAPEGPDGTRPTGSETPAIGADSAGGSGAGARKDLAVGGCGCDASAGPASLGVSVLGALWATRRRRRS